MNFEINVISRSDYEKKYNKKVTKIKKASKPYVKLTPEQKEQRRMDREYYNNWIGSIRKMKAKSQRLADLNNRYYNA